jgi:hypothetical protein
MPSPQPKLSPLYGAAFGFNTDRRVKPVHFASGFFLALTGINYKQKALNFTVASPSKKEPEGTYKLSLLKDYLLERQSINALMTDSDIHKLRKHLEAVADNDDAVYAMFGKNAGFGSDYSISSHDLVSRLKDNDGFTGQFVKNIFESSHDGRSILGVVRGWLQQHSSVARMLLSPLIDEDCSEEDLETKASSRLGEMNTDRRQAIATLMQEETAAVLRVCENVDHMTLEAKLRFVVIISGCWLAAYLRKVACTGRQESLVLLTDMSNGESQKMREQSRWSYSRFREALGACFHALAERGDFSDCETLWQWVLEKKEGKPKIEEFCREILIRNGLAQPRASRVSAKHFELQPDTLHVLTLSVLSKTEGLVALPDYMDRIFQTWAICFGGRSLDPELLAESGYTGLDQDRDLSPNTDGLVSLLADLGLATCYSDGLVMCHCAPNFNNR